MSAHLEAYRIPTSLDEALTLLADESATVVAGATVRPYKVTSRIKTLVDISRCGLWVLAVVEDAARIGATTVVADLAARADLDGFGSGMLREAAIAVAPMSVRNQVTVGGNIAGYMTWSDLPIALMALDARVHTAKAGGDGRTLTMEELFAQHPRRVLQAGELIVGVEVPRPAAGSGGAFLKEAVTETDTALVDVGVLLQVEDGVCTAARIVVGAFQPRPGHAAEAEAALVGQTLTEELCAEAGQAAADHAKVGRDMRVSQDYRRRLLAVIVKRAIHTAWQRATGSETYSAPRRLVPPPWPDQPPSDALAQGVISLTVDGRKRRFHARPADRLLDVLRNGGVIAPKEGCDTGYCGACTLLVNGRLLNTCLVLACYADGAEVVTAAGLGTPLAPHPIQRTFVEEGAVQCGFCTPSMVVTTKALLDQIPDATDEEIRETFDGILCRCTGYVKPLAAIRASSDALQGKE